MPRGRSGFCWSGGTRRKRPRGRDDAKQFAVEPPHVDASRTEYPRCRLGDLVERAGVSAR